MKTIRIESDGTPAGTKVFDTETGQPLHGIKKVTWEIAVKEVASATVTFCCPEITAPAIYSPSLRSFLSTIFTHFPQRNSKQGTANKSEEKQ